MMNLKSTLAEAAAVLALAALSVVVAYSCTAEAMTP